MANSTVKVSVITLMYNTGKEVVETIRSVHEDSYPNLVHEIFDDCSTDDSVKRVSDYIQDRGLQSVLHENAYNLGINENKKKALNTVEGELILGLSDDLLYPGRVWSDVQLYSELKEHERDNLFGFFGPVEMFDTMTGETTQILDPFPELDQTTVITNDQMARLLLKKNVIPAISVTLIKSSVDRVEKPKGFFIEDYPLWVNAVLEGFDFLYRPFIATRYRQTAKSVQITRMAEVVRDKFYCKKLLLAHDSISVDLGQQELWRTYFNNILNFDSGERKLIIKLLFNEDLRIMNALKGFISFAKGFAKRHV